MGDDLGLGGAAFEHRDQRSRDVAEEVGGVLGVLREGASLPREVEVEQVRPFGDRGGFGGDGTATLGAGGAGRSAMDQQVERGHASMGAE
nr:hypothetical protein [Deltaproteobacteria bacterium]